MAFRPTRWQARGVPAGWGGRDRTSEWRNQNPLPYRLATPQYAAEGTAEEQTTADSAPPSRSIERSKAFQPPAAVKFRHPTRLPWQALDAGAPARFGPEDNH